jgi:hypothetical protein
MSCIVCYNNRLLSTRGVEGADVKTHKPELLAGPPSRSAVWSSCAAAPSACRFASAAGCHSKHMLIIIEPANIWNSMDGWSRYCPFGELLSMRQWFVISGPWACLKLIRSRLKKQYCFEKSVKNYWGYIFIGHFDLRE